MSRAHATKSELQQCAKSHSKGKRTARSVERGVRRAVSVADLATHVQAKSKEPIGGDRFEREADAVGEMVSRSTMTRAVSPSFTRSVHSSASNKNAGIQVKRATPTKKTMSMEPSPAVKDLGGPGEPLPESVRDRMEPLLGHDLSPVRIHTGAPAEKLNQGFGSRAFAAGSHVAFAKGQYDPLTSSGLRLLGHELAHVVQQGAAGPQTEGSAPVRMSRLNSAGTQFAFQFASDEQEEEGGVWGDIAEYAGKVAGTAVKAIPGYGPVTWLFGYDPIDGETVPRTLDTLIDRVAGPIVPALKKLYEKIVESGLIEEAQNWLDKNLTKHNLTKARIQALINSAGGFSSLILKGAEEIKQLFEPILDDVRSFLSDLTDQALELLRTKLLTPLLTFIQKQTDAYPLLTVILGQDPITGEEVKRTPMNVLSAFMNFTKSGKEALAKLKESGRLQKMLTWLDKQVEKLDLSAETIRALFIEIWNSFDATSILQPGETFNRIWQIVHEPVGRLITFVTVVGGRALNLIKDWLLGKLKERAEKVPGYPLLAVILERDPVTQKVVPRTAENFIRGFMSLVPGGLDKYKALEESGTIPKALKWLGGEVASLGLSWKEIVGAFKEAWRLLKISDVLDSVNVLTRIVELFASPVKKIAAFAFVVVKKVVELIFEGLMGSAGARIIAVFKRTKRTFNIILDDPVKFAGHLLEAVKIGFEQFADNILDHLKAGIFGWLFGALSGAGIELPEKFDLRGIVSIVLQILGITYARFRKKLVKHLGEKAVGRLETVFDFLKRLVTEGPIVIWEKIVESIGNLKDMVIDAIKSWVVSKVVTAAVTKIVSMLNPVGAIVQAVLAIYNTISFFIERIKQIIALVESILDSISNIAEGRISDAANYVEKTMGRAVPVIISFLARLVGLGNVSEMIRSLIEKIQAKVDKAIDKVVGFIIKKAKGLLAKGKAAVGKVVSWWKQRKKFKIGKEKHSIFIEGDDKPSEIMVASDKQTLKEFVEKSKLSDDKKKEIRGLAEKIDKLKRPEGKAVSFSKEAGKKIAGYLEKIAALLKGTKGERPESVVKKQTVRSQNAPLDLNGDGELVHVSPLSIVPGKLVGSKPYGESPLWIALKKRKDTYVRGHLLNHQVHGPGEIWNMTPIPRNTNSQMEKSFESDVKGAVMEENKVVDYCVEVIYGKRGKRKLGAERAIAKVLKLKAVLMEKKDDGKSGTDPKNWKKTSTIVAKEDLDVVLPANTGSGRVEVGTLNLGNYDPKQPDSSEPDLVEFDEEDDAFEIASQELQENVSGIGEKRAEAILLEQPTTEDELLKVPNVPLGFLEKVGDLVKSSSKFVLEGRNKKSRYKNS